MKDKRIEKIKQHYTVILNGKAYKVLKHKIDREKSLLAIKTKIFGQGFPQGNHISACFPEDPDQTFILLWEGKNSWKDEKVEHWEYKIVTQPHLQT